MINNWRICKGEQLQLHQQYAAFKWCRIRTKIKKIKFGIWEAEERTRKYKIKSIDNNPESKVLRSTLPSWLSLISNSLI